LKTSIGENTKLVTAQIVERRKKAQDKSARIVHVSLGPRKDPVHQAKIYPVGYGWTACGRKVIPVDPSYKLHREVNDWITCKACMKKAVPSKLGRPSFEEKRRQLLLEEEEQQERERGGGEGGAPQ